MAHTCSCCAGSTAVLDVREMAPRVRHPKIFHCCGAGLTLTEAAASAGADPSALLAALNEVA